MTATGESIEIQLDDRTRELTRREAADLQDAIGAALTEKREFFRTAGEYREDGSYVVSRRGADSTGNAKVFESFEALRRLFVRLPAEFTAEDVGRTGITGSRRHMLVRHLCEHPEFACSISRRNPLTGQKSSEATAESGADSETEAEPADAPTPAD